MSRSSSAGRSRFKKAFVAAILLPTLLLAPVVYGYRNAIDQRQDAGRDDSSMIGKPLPAFALPTRDGNIAATADFMQGRYIFNIFASWCSYCAYEHPVWMELDAEVADAHIIGVAWSDDAGATGRWLEKHGDPYDTVITDRDGTLAVALGVGGAPETYLVDDGIIVGYIEGVTDAHDKDALLLPFISGTYTQTLPGDDTE